MSFVLSIDFGTSNSLAGGWGRTGRQEALPLDSGAPDPTLMRSLLHFLDQDRVTYGHAALDSYIENDFEGRLFRSFKTHLSNRDYLGTVIGSRIVTVEFMIGIFLLEMKKRAQTLLNHQIERVVLGRPARYSMDPMKDEFAKYRMKKAAELAGFQEIHFVPEPLAAALEYRRHLKEEKIVLVADFGGGTSDFTVLKVGPHDFSPDDVLAIEGCPLAGDALDAAIMRERLSVHFGSNVRYRVPLGSNVMTMPPTIKQRLEHPAYIAHLREKETYEFLRNVKNWALGARDREAMDRLFVLVDDQQIFPVFERIEKTKRDLSKLQEAGFDFSYPGIELNESIRRSEFESWISPVKDKIVAALDNSLTLAGIQSDQVDLVFLTGGTAQVPVFQAELERRFGKHKLTGRQQFHSVLSGLTEAAGRVFENRWASSVG